MKRPPSPSVSDVSAPPRRKRGLSDEERALWESVAKQIKPLAQEASHRKAPAASPDAETSAAAKPAASLGPLPSAKIPRTPRPEGPPTAPPLAPLDAASVRNCRVGGKRSMPARPARHDADARPPRAIGFLQRAHRDGLTFVLVITGKGRAIGADSERGVLRRQVPQWLSLPEFRSLVVGFEEAHIGHGGEGALYVRIRRSRM